jgi:signal transduction histidine kinase
MKELEPHFLQDIESVQKISVIPSILKVICHTTGMRFAAVARVTAERWIACAVKDEMEFGVTTGGELKVETTICHEIRQSGTLVVIDNVEEDEIYRYHHSPKLYGIQSYISVPVVLKGGIFFGTLCAIDPAPAAIKNDNIIEMFKLYAELIGIHISSIREQDEMKLKLEEERDIAKLRDKFIAILGHDLNNPLNAVSMSAHVIQEIAKEETVINLANIIKDSSKRMNGLIEDVLDFARGQLGAGIHIYRNQNESIEEQLQEVISEFKVVYPDRLLDVQIQVGASINCDEKRIAQLFSNLLGNAYKYGDAGKPIKIFAGNKKGDFILSVANACERIPDEDLKRLFQPFYHGIKVESKSLGLGLYISSEIAKAHDASLEVASTDDETTFTFCLPG